MSIHLIKRGRIYHFRILIPKDLLGYFPQPEVRKSLKTANLSAAKILHASWEDKIQKSFAFLRNGFASDDQIATILKEFLPKSPKLCHATLFA